MGHVNAAAVSKAIAPPPPSLPTLVSRPTWINRAGRIDRSACAELRASDIWRLVPTTQWRSKRKAVLDRRVAAHSPSERGRPAARKRAGSRFRSCESFARFTITASFLAALHDTRLPLHLSGDLRTSKSNVMKSHLYAPPHMPTAMNPNKGATRVKKLGVWGGCAPGDEHSPRFREGWTQEIRIERWRLHDRLAQHFLICPACQRKYLKLFLPVASEREIADARVAEGWVRMLDARHIVGRVPLDRETMALRAKIIDRYGLLFHDRHMLCRRCLGLRYGEVKWRRFMKRAARLESMRKKKRPAGQGEANERHSVIERAVSSRPGNLPRR